MKMHGFDSMGAWTIALMVAVGCAGNDSKGDGGTTGEESSGTTDRDTDGMTGAGSLTNMTTGSMTTTMPGLDSTGDDPGEESAGFITNGMSDGPIDPGPNGAMCSSNDDCTSGYCYEVPSLGGFCSECINDSDCDAGTCSLDFNLLYAVCTDGQLGVMCDSTRGCMEGLVCEPLVDTGGFFPLDFCSECGAEAPCEGEQLCTPVYDQVAFQGYHGCVDPGSVPNGGGCPVNDGQGDPAVCMSGNCAVANVFMVVDIGVCGE
jgi:hypothetical protein